MKKPTHERLTDFVKNNDIYLFGPMGVGKTTLVDNIREVADINYVSMGEVTRSAIRNGDTRVTDIIQRGGKLPLDAVRDIISPHIGLESSYVLDGVPRHPDEAEWVKEHAMKRRFGAVALTLYADNDTVRDRISVRSASADNERSETPDRIAARLEVYRKNKESIINVLRPALRDIIEIDTSRLTPGGVMDELYERL